MDIILIVAWISGLSFAIEQGYMEAFGKPMKPFSCAVCLSLWIGIGTALITHDYLFAFLPYLATRLTGKYLLQ